MTRSKKKGLAVYQTKFKTGANIFSYVSQKDDRTNEVFEIAMMMASTNQDIISEQFIRNGSGVLVALQRCS